MAALKRYVQREQPLKEIPLRDQCRPANWALALSHSHGISPLRHTHTDRACTTAVSREPQMNPGVNSGSQLYEKVSPFPDSHIG